VSTDNLALDDMACGLPTAVIGRALHRHALVGSTNDLARQHARAGAAEGLVILAEEQRAGRGRQGRGWAAPAGSSLLLSLLLRPAWLPPADAFALTMLAGVALCEATEEIAQIPAALKWPNDLLLPAGPGMPPATHKAAGILSEVELEQDQLSWVIVGMGINVNWSPAGIVDGRDLAQVATSLAAVAARPIERAALLRALLIRLDIRYRALRQGRREELFAAWRERLATLDQSVVVRLSRGDLCGVAVGVEASGALLLRDEGGVVHSILAGDVGV
jgi:BirA family biotin operon repressor/biotin-[acetyl-CoA-carboxylase] ligase